MYTNEAMLAMPALMLCQLITAGFLAVTPTRVNPRQITDANTHECKHPISWVCTLLLNLPDGTAWGPTAADQAAVAGSGVVTCHQDSTVHTCPVQLPGV
jgi:hypothetical protein